MNPVLFKVEPVMNAVQDIFDQIEVDFSECSIDEKILPTLCKLLCVVTSRCRITALHSSVSSISRSSNNWKQKIFVWVSTLGLFLPQKSDILREKWTGLGEKWFSANPKSNNHTYPNRSTLGLFLPQKSDILREKWTGLGEKWFSASPKSNNHTYPNRSTLGLFLPQKSDILREKWTFTKLLASP